MCPAIHPRRGYHSEKTRVVLHKAKDSQWIVGARWDIAFFSASPLASMAFLQIYRHADTVSPVWGEYLCVLAFYALGDYPHVFQTFARTHWDKAEFKRRPLLYSYGLVGLALLGLAIKSCGGDEHLLNFMALYGMWHIYRQNHGLLKMYHTLSHQKGAWQKKEQICFAFCALAMVCTRITLRFCSSTAVCEGFKPLFFISLAAIVFLEAKQARRGNFQIGRCLFLGSILSSYYWIYTLNLSPQIFIAVETLYHDIQYQGWMLNYQRRRFGAKFSWRHLSATFVAGLAVGVLLLAAGYVRILQWVTTPVLMLVLFHYYIDGKVWRFSSCPELKLLLPPR